ncbi:hypothetical protein SAMN05421823_11913 [Catalinimonas alkaloidigena]|uniref:Uncharacterized protein n=1 Tax=Catalinimonas alkaloidigena TaxID=1075417 RepID=A0A1G9V4N4_9BACT|nr:hypothetical protein [Catalinimonas alkaloidigena]SDM67037.1 hypothetical protein SAMN05421823_11913 [Catalinimonas alkaloidigena]
MSNKIPYEFRLDKVERLLTASLAPDQAYVDLNQDVSDQDPGSCKVVKADAPSIVLTYPALWLVIGSEGVYLVSNHVRPNEISPRKDLTRRVYATGTDAIRPAPGEQESIEMIVAFRSAELQRFIQDNRKADSAFLHLLLYLTSEENKFRLSNQSAFHPQVLPISPSQEESAFHPRVLPISPSQEE